MADGIFKYRKHGKPAWGVRLKFQHEDGIWRAKEWRGFLSRQDAIDHRDREREIRYRLKWFPERPGSDTVQEYFNHWMTTYAASHCKYSTFHDYGLILNRHLLPAVGHVPLAALTTAHLKHILIGLTGRRRQTIRNIFTPIREALNHAVAEGRIPHNPADALGPVLKQAPGSRRAAQPLTSTQITKLLQATKPIDHVLHTAVLLGARAGLRVGEMLGLRWQDIDRRRRQAIIRHTIVRRQSATPKNHRARTVDLPDSVLTALRALPRGTPEQAVLRRHTRTISPEWLARAFKTACQTAQVPRIRLHDLRHTYASHLIALGATPKYIQAQLGHSSIAVTFDIYGHLMETERFVDRLDRPQKRSAG